MIDFHCPHCHDPMSVPESLAGHRDTCPSCGRSVEVPPLDPTGPWLPADKAHSPSVKTERPDFKPTFAEHTLTILTALVLGCSLVAGLICVLVGTTGGAGYILVGLGLAAGGVVSAAWLQASAAALGYLRTIARSVWRP